MAASSAGSMFLITAMYAVPLYMLAVISLKRPDQIASSPLSFPLHPTFSGFSQAWRQGRLGQAFFSSLIVTTVSVAVLVVLGSLAAYAIARRTDRLCTMSYALFIAGLTLPMQLSLVPLYQLMRDLGLLGSYWSLVLAYAGRHLPLTILLYASFLRAVPRDYEEAAMVDGSSTLQTFFTIVFPLLRPVTATVVVLTGVEIWNDFLTPLLYLSGTGRQTLTVSVYSFVNEYTSQWNILFAGLIIASAPMMLIYLLAQKTMVKSFGSGLKG